VDIIKILAFFCFTFILINLSCQNVLKESPENTLNCDKATVTGKCTDGLTSGVIEIFNYYYEVVNTQYFWKYDSSLVSLIWGLRDLSDKKVKKGTYIAKLSLTSFDHDGYSVCEEFLVDKVLDSNDVVYFYIDPYEDIKFGIKSN